MKKLSPPHHLKGVSLYLLIAIAAITARAMEFTNISWLYVSALLWVPFAMLIFLILFGFSRKRDKLK